MSTVSLPLPTAATVARRADPELPGDRATPGSRPRTRPARARRRVPEPAVLRQLFRFCVIGVSSTGFQLGLFVALRAVLGPFSANLVALVVSNVINTSLNRRLTFGISGRRDLARQQLFGLAIMGMSLALTSGALALLNLAAPAPPRSAELVVLVAANTLGAVARFALLRGWVFSRR
jgi:putative flippase GtrA